MSEIGRGRERSDGKRDLSEVGRRGEGEKE